MPIKIGTALLSSYDTWIAAYAGTSGEELDLVAKLSRRLLTGHRTDTDVSSIL